MELSLIGLQNAGKSSLVNVIATGAFQQDMIPTVGFNMRKVTRGAVTIKLWDLGGQANTALLSHLGFYVQRVLTCTCLAYFFCSSFKLVTFNDPKSDKRNLLSQAHLPVDACSGRLAGKLAVCFSYSQPSKRKSLLPLQAMRRKSSKSMCSGLQPRFRAMWERYCRGVQAIVYVIDAADHEGLEQAKQEFHDLLAKPSLSSIPVLVLGNKNDLPGALSVEQLIDRLDLKVLFLLPASPYSALI